jgi:hypothetical protein
MLGSRIRASLAARCGVVTLVGTWLRVGAARGGPRAVSPLILRVGTVSLRSPAVSLTAFGSVNPGSNPGGPIGLSGMVVKSGPLPALYAKKAPAW